MTQTAAEVAAEIRISIGLGSRRKLPPEKTVEGIIQRHTNAIVAEKDTEIERLKQQLASREATIKKCLAAATGPKVYADYSGDAAFNFPLEDAAEYVHEKFVELNLEHVRTFLLELAPFIDAKVTNPVEGGE